MWRTYELSLFGSLLSVLPGSLLHKSLTGVYFVLYTSCWPKEVCTWRTIYQIDHQQWHLPYDILENNKLDVEKLTKNIERVYYCNEFALFWRGFATPLKRPLKRNKLCRFSQILKIIVWVFCVLLEMFSCFVLLRK